MTIYLLVDYSYDKMSNQELTAFLRSNIEESIDRHGFPLSSDGCDYLGDFLTRYVDATRLFREYRLEGKNVRGLKPITFQHFEAFEEKGLAEKTVVLQNLAEECLFLVGFCYEYVRKNGLGQVRFHSDMGAAAYGSLAVLTGQPVFPEVAEQFDTYSVVVGDLHIPELKKDHRRFKRVIDRWMETRDRRYELLVEGVLGSSVVSSFGNKDSQN